MDGVNRKYVWEGAIDTDNRMLTEIFLIWAGAANAVAVIMTLLDKSFSRKKGARRIPEWKLFAAALLGGAFGMYVTMRKIRHKTLHKRFMIGLPVIIAVQILAVGFGGYCMQAAGSGLGDCVRADGRSRVFMMILAVQWVLKLDRTML